MVSLGFNMNYRPSILGMIRILIIRRVAGIGKEQFHWKISIRAIITDPIHPSNQSTLAADHLI